MGGGGSLRSQRLLWLQAVFTCEQFSSAASPRARAETKPLSLIRDFCSLPVRRFCAAVTCKARNGPESRMRGVDVAVECEKCGRTGSDKSTAAFLYAGVSSLGTDAYVFLRVGEGLLFPAQEG